MLIKNQLKANSFAQKAVCYVQEYEKQCMLFKKTKHKKIVTPSIVYSTV